MNILTFYYRTPIYPSQIYCKLQLITVAFLPHKISRLIRGLLYYVIIVMVSTQTTLTCSRSESLLPQSLLYNIITSKLTEAFELTNLHATFCDYKDNLSTVKVT